MSAAFEGKMDIVSLLLDNGADVSQKTSDNWTAMDSAELGGHMEIARSLQDALLDGKENRTANIE